MAERRDGEPAVDPRTVRALLALTLTAGMIDAIAFLGLEQVFAANMTGNLIVLGLAIAGAPLLSVGGPAAALAAFLLGAAASGRFDRRAESRHRRLLRMVRIEALAVALAALVAVGFESGDEVRRFAKELKRFNDDLQTKAGGLQARFTALASTWQDQENVKFAEEFVQTMKTLKKFIEISEQHTPFLLRKAQRIEEYLDQR